MGARPFDRLRVTDVSCAVIVLGMVGISGLDGSLLWRTLRVVAFLDTNLQ